MYLKCHFAIPRRFRGERIHHFTQLAHHKLEVTFQRRSLRGSYIVPDWWLDSSLGLYPQTPTN